MSTTNADVEEWIGRARGGDPEALGRLLDAHREALRALAGRRLTGRIAARVGVSDVVQTTFLEAHRDFGRFLGRGGPELVAWLASILEHNIAATLRDHAHAQKRDLRRERPLPGPTEDGRPARLEPHDGRSSPSRKAMRGELRERVALVLATLPDDQREAVRLRHLEGWPLARIAAHLGRSPSAVAGLIKRGMQTLRRNMPPED